MAKPNALAALIRTFCTCGQDKSGETKPVQAYFGGANTMYYDKKNGRWCEIGEDDMDELPDLSPPPISKLKEDKPMEVKYGVDALLVPSNPHAKLTSGHGSALRPPVQELQGSAVQQLDFIGGSGSISGNPSAQVAIPPGGFANTWVNSSTDAVIAPPDPTPVEQRLAKHLNLQDSSSSVSRYYLIQLLGLMVVVVKIIHIGVKGANLGQGGDVSCHL